MARRLFLGVAAAAGLSMLAAAQAQQGSAWTSDVKRGPEGNVAEATAMSSATDVNVEGDLSAGGEAMLVLRCRGGSTQVYLSFPVQVATAPARVSVRVNRRVVRTEEWERSANGTAVGLWSDKSVAIRLARSLVANGAASMTFERSDGRMVSASFDLSGIAEAIRPLREACGW